MSHPPAHLRRPLPATWRWLAAFCALTVGLLDLLTASTELHETLHAEAGHADHTCAVTLFSEGIENPTGAAVITVVPGFLPAGDVCALPAAPWKDAGNRLPPGRGPPLG